jgi:hypothetical protein
MPEPHDTNPKDNDDEHLLLILILLLSLEGGLGNTYI